MQNFLFLQLKWESTAVDVELELQSMLCPIAEKLEQCERLPVEWPKVGIPFVQPLLELFSDNPLADFSETSSMSAQVERLWNWLEEGRRWAKQTIELDQYYSKICPKEILQSENFLCTEFSLKFLFGSKGYKLEAKKRYDKLAAVANTLRERCNLKL